MPTVSKQVSRYSTAASTYLPHAGEQVLVNRSRAARARCRDASLPAKAGPRTALCALRAATQRDLLRPSPAGSALRDLGPRVLLQGEGGWKAEAERPRCTRTRTRTYIRIQVLRRPAQVQLSTPGPYTYRRTPQYAPQNRKEVPSSVLHFQAPEHEHVRTLHMRMHARRYR